MQAESVNRAFSKQSAHFDDEDRANAVLVDLRKQVYDHVSRYLRPSSHILELNAGTGIDAFHFAALGHRVLATDLSDGMIRQIQEKIDLHPHSQAVRCRQLSYDQLDALEEKNFDHVFSNFGGLNCIEDLNAVTQHLPALLKPGAYVTWVIMPPVCFWEWFVLIKGRPQVAFRRFKKGGAPSHLEGEYFQTYYHSLSRIKAAFGPSFRLVAAEGLAALSPQPHRGDFPARHPATYRLLRKADALVRNHYPFNRWADHIIVTFQYRKGE